MPEKEGEIHVEARQQCSLLSTLLLASEQLLSYFTQHNGRAAAIRAGTLQCKSLSEASTALIMDTTRCEEV